MTTLRRRTSRLAASGAVLATLLAVPLAGRTLRPVTAPPETPVELAELFRRHRPDLHVIPANTTGPDNGIYICERPRPRDQVLALPRQPAFAGRWGGVVCCERVAPMREVAAGELAAWGEHGMRAGPLLFFGDPR